MKISAVKLYSLQYRLKDEKYSWSNDLYITKVGSWIVEVVTDQGLSGFGEVCPLGPAYMDAFAEGVPAAVELLARALLDEDPRQLNLINQRMDLALGGHNYAKSPLDIACWDLLGKVSGLSVATLLGGCAQYSVPLYRAIPQRSPAEMADDVKRYRSLGYRKFQLKVGGDSNEDIARIRACRSVLESEDVLVADANTGWIPHEAIRVANAVSDLDVYIEQPCRTLSECLAVRRATSLPMVLDELIRGLDPLVEAHQQGAMDVVNIKISRVGGFTKAKAMRDLCEGLGIAMTIEDSWGGDVTTAAIAHLAGSTRSEFHFSSTDFNSYVDISVAPDAPTSVEGRFTVPQKPGLGIQIDRGVLGNPDLVIESTR